MTWCGKEVLRLWQTDEDLRTIWVTENPAALLYCGSLVNFPPALGCKTMGPNCKTNLVALILLASWSLSPIAAQNMSVDISKRATSIPEACQSVVPASIEGRLDIPALIKEAICKGAGDMLIGYTYVMNVQSRTKEKRGKIKEETTTYEVFIPILRSGMLTRGIMLVTSHNGTPVPPADLEKERRKTGERLEKEEDKIARADAPAPPPDSDSVKGMLPLGMYTRKTINRAAFGLRIGSATLDVGDFLGACDLTLLRRERPDGREILVFRFAARPDAHFDDNERYATQLTGEIWIDATDRIVTRLVGWPHGPAIQSLTASSADPPAVYAEMMRLREGIWLPRLIRINGLDYPKLFDHIGFDSIWTYSDFIHFSTEIKEYKVNTPKKP